MRKTELLSESLVLGGSVALVFGIGYLDFISGWELGFFVFYFLPIAIVAWKLGFGKSYAIATLCTVIWFVTDWTAAQHYSIYYVYWNTFIHLIAYIVIAYSVAKIRTLIDLEKETSRQLQKARDSLEVKLEERTRDLKKIHLQLAVKEKMASVGQLAAGIAHELNNPMSFVATNFSTLQEDIGAFRDVVSFYREILETLHKKGMIDESLFREIKSREDAVALNVTG